MMHHRTKLVYIFILSLIFLAFEGTLVSSLAQQVPLNPTKIKQFVDPLPVPHTITGTHDTDATQIELQMTEFKYPVISTGFVPAKGGPPYTGTWVWGYLEPNQTVIPSYIGPVIINQRGIPTQIKFVNNLGNTATSNVLAYVNSTDQTLHWADPLNAEDNMCNHMIMPMMPPMPPCDQHYAGSIPAVVHLHGGEVPPMLDGGPDAWFTSDGLSIGHAFYSMGWDGMTPQNYAIYRYPNTQEASPIWFHDHTLGATRLNVYAGLAGGYIITDPPNDPSNLPALVPLVIQDRMFDTNGQLFFPNIGINPEHPFWLPEFVGDVIVVNGKTWPYLNVEPKRYQFLFLNGSNARTYELFLINRVTGVKGPVMWVIGTDGGYLDTPVKIDPNVKPNDKLIVMPGERYDVIIDFTGQAGASFELRNTAKTPYPAGAPVTGATTGRIMRFNVNLPLAGPDNSYNPATGGALRAPMTRLVNPAAGTLDPTITVNQTRQLTLNEVMGPGGPLEILVNNTKWDGKSVAKDIFPPDGIRPDFTPTTTGGVTTYYSELPQEGETEVWEIVNLTADAHPIHLHLVQFQLINRQPFDVKLYNAAYNALFPATTTLDPMTGLPYPGGVYIGGYGPPLDYTTGNLRALGGNPDITPYLLLPVKVPLPQEAGWKDTVVMYPGEVARIAVRWTPTDLGNNTPSTDPSAAYPFDPNGGHGYVWHCHIIDHEDNEMMRPDIVQPNGGATRTFVQGIDY